MVQTGIERFWGKGQRWSDKWQSDSMAHKDGAQLDESTLHLLRILTKMTLRLEEEVGRYRADTGFMLFVDTLTEQNTLQLLRDAAQEWQKSFEEGTVKSSLRMQVKDDRPPLAQDQVMHHVETLMRVGTSPTTLPRLKTLHKLGVETPNTKVVPFKISVSLRGPEAQSMFEALTALSCGALKLLGLRLRPERMQKTALATELENAYLNTSFTDWTRRSPQWGRSSKKGGSDQ